MEAKPITETSRRATAERFRLRGLDINVDRSKSPNQFRLDAISTEPLQQNALSHPIMTYCLIQKKNKDTLWYRTEDLAVLKKGVTKYNMAREIPKYCDLTLQELFPIKQDILFEGNTFNIMMR